MYKLFVLCFAILSLVCTIQCTPTASKRNIPSPRPRNMPSPRPRSMPSPRPRSMPSSRPRSLAARGHCDFFCPYENVTGGKLSKYSADSGRLYCRYDVEEADDGAYCMYQRNTGELVSGSFPSECEEQAVFDCPGTKSGQEDMKWAPSQPRDSGPVNLPQFVKARSMARRAVGDNTV